MSDTHSRARGPSPLEPSRTLEQPRPLEGPGGLSLATLSILYFIGVIAVAHLFMSPPYGWTAHSISKLAAQATPNAWLMRLGFLGFGLGLLIHLVRLGSNGSARQPVAFLVAIYAVAVAISGVFSTSPVDAPAPRPWEAGIHRAAAVLAGFSLSAAILVSVVRSRSPLERFSHFVALVLVIVLSALFEFGEPGTALVPPGIAQRALYLTGLIWLLVAQSGWEVPETGSDATGLAGRPG